MVKILSDRNHNYALDCGDCIVYWSKPGSSDYDKLVMDWCVDKYTFALRVQVGEFANAKEELKVLDKTKYFLKNFINKTHNTLPVTPVKDDYGFFNDDYEYTDIETNDACRVPKYEWAFAKFTIDGDKDSIMQLHFQNNGTPWFCGDGYNMPDDAWMQLASKKWDAKFIEKFKEIPEGSSELANFYKAFVEDMLKSIETRIDKLNKKLSEQEAKKKVAKEHVEKELNKLKNSENAELKDIVAKFAADNKIDISEVVKFANKLKLLH